MRAAQRTRTDRWPSTVTTCSALSYSISTSDPSLSMASVPMPTLVVRLGGGVGAQFVTAQPLPPTPRPYNRLPSETTSAEPEEQANRFESEEQPAAQAEMEDLGRTETAETAQAEHEEPAQPEPE